jgi:hypothetical protein
MHALTSLGRFIRRTPPPPVELLEAYAHEVIPVLDRAEWLYHYWLEQSTLFTDGEKLGNVAAIHRWEITSMGRSLERVVPPSVLAGPHEDVLDALETASRATQLLSNGSRFHNANAVCEGLAMLGVSRERRLAARRSMYRYLERVAPSAIAETAASAAEAASSAALAEVAARSASTTEPGSTTEPTATAEPTVTAETAAAPMADESMLAPASPAETSTLAPAHPASSEGTTDADVPGGEAALPPELATLDLVVTDTPEPEPAWLAAARNASESRAPASEALTSEAPTSPAEPTPAATPAPAATPDTSTDPAADWPADAEQHPPPPSGWGSLFGGRNP